MMAGRPAAAKSEWQSALAVLEAKLKDDPRNTALLHQRVLLLGLTGQVEAARAAWQPLSELTGGQTSIAWGNAVQILTALDEKDAAVVALERLWASLSGGAKARMLHQLEHHPAYTPLRSIPRVQAILDEGRRWMQDLKSRAAPKPATRIDGADSAIAADDKSVAVLAFANLSDDKANEYFSDGISEELLNVLAKVPGLKVTARTSAFHFKGKDTPIPEIARHLGVAYVVEGSVRKAGDKVRITAQLIKAADGFHVWSDTFTRDLKDIFAVQDEIAGLIAQNLSLKLGTSSVRKVAAVNPQAFELYVQARQAWSLRTPEGFARAEQMLNRALELAPDFVRARAALIDVVQMRSLRERKVGAFGQRHSSEIDQRLAQVRAVLAIDPDLAEAYSTLGQALDSKWQRDEAGQAYQRATELNPNYATGRHWYGMHLAELGRMDEALAEVKAACDLDPFSFIILDNYGWLLNLAGRNREAVQMLDRAAALNPGFDQTARAKAAALAALGRTAEARAIARQLKNLQRELDVWTLGLVGLHDEARALLQRMEPSDITNRFQALLAAGQREAALAALADPSGASKGDSIDTLFQPIYDPVRTDPRFIQYLATLGLNDAHSRAQAWRKAHPPERPATGQP
jgi:TolB-like protein/Tfp pilus assembly protein PilF